MKNTARWIQGLALIFIGIYQIFLIFFFGFTILILGLLIIPPTFKIIESRYKINISKRLKIRGVIFLSILCPIFFVVGINQHEKKVRNIKDSANLLIKQNRVKEADLLLDNQLKKNNLFNFTAYELKQEIAKSISIDSAKTVLHSLNKKQLRLLENDNLDTILINNQTLDSNFKKLLKKVSLEEKINKSKIEDN